MIRFARDSDHHALEAGQRLVGIAESGSVAAFGDRLSDYILAYVGAVAVSVYRLEENTPVLIYSKEIPDGLHADYESYGTNDMMLGRLLGGRSVVHDQMMRGTIGWINQGNLDFLRKWGFGHCMAGAIRKERSVVAVIYIGRSSERGAFQREEILAFELACRAAGISFSLPRFDLNPNAEDISREHEKGVSADSGEFHYVEILPRRGSQVAQLLCEGKSNKEIAAHLSISVHTVKEHLTTLYRRFSVSNRTELAGKLLRSSGEGKT